MDPFNADGLPSEPAADLAARFDGQRLHLRALAYRLLGSVGEADDAVQETWLRLTRAHSEEIDNLEGWLRTVVTRVCLNLLRARENRREESLDVQVPEPILDRAAGADPEHEALLAESVGLALSVVLEKLSTAERVAFVLHDMFSVPFADIAGVLDRSPDAVRQLASRARRRVRDGAPIPESSMRRQRSVADAFLSAAREGDFEALLQILDPNVVFRVDYGPESVLPSREIRGAAAVADEAATFSRLRGPGMITRAAIVNGAAGQVAFRDGQPFSILGFTVADGRLAAIDILADPERLRRIDFTVITEA